MKNSTSDREGSEGSKLKAFHFIKFRQKTLIFVITTIMNKQSRKIVVLPFKINLKLICALKTKKATLKILR